MRAVLQLFAVIVLCFSLQLTEAQNAVSGVAGGGAARKARLKLRPPQEPLLVDPSSPLTQDDLVILIVSSVSRLSLVEASRPVRRGIRTVVAIESAQDAAALTNRYGKEHLETYVAVEDRDNTTLSLARRQGPRWGLAPLAAHRALGGARYKWLLLGHDDTLWSLRNTVALLADFNITQPFLVADHLMDFNGDRLMAPSHAPTACMPCHMNLTATMGRRKPPGFPWSGCPACRPAMGCEFRWEACSGLAGGPLCHSKRFLGTGDRCPPSWHNGGAGVAVSVGLVVSLKVLRYTQCTLNFTQATGERTFARCMWRSGYAFTLPGAAVTRSKRAFDDRYVAFDPPLARFALLEPDPLAAVATAAKADDAQASGTTAASHVVASSDTMTAAAAAVGLGKGGGAGATSATMRAVSSAGMAVVTEEDGAAERRRARWRQLLAGADTSSRITTAAAAAGNGSGDTSAGGVAGTGPMCDVACVRWALSNAVSLHVHVSLEASGEVLREGVARMGVVTTRMLANEAAAAAAAMATEDRAGTSRQRQLQLQRR